MSMDPMPEEKLVLLLPKRCISVLQGIVARHVQEAQRELDYGIRREDQSLISSSEAVLRCLDPITKELELAKVHF